MATPYPAACPSPDASKYTAEAFVLLGCGGVWRTAGYENTKKSTLAVATNNKLH